MNNPVLQFAQVEVHHDGYGYLLDAWGNGHERWVFVGAVTFGLIV